VTGSITIIPNSYVVVPVILTTSAGQGTTNFNNGHNLILGLITQGAAGPQGITGPQGQTGLGGSTTGTASIEFEDALYGILEVPEGRVLVNDANVLLTSTINITVGTSSDHDSIEDAVYEDLNFKYEITTPGQFTIYGYAPLDTFGVWNLIYRVIN
jgi:hypothetical protein